MEPWPHEAFYHQVFHPLNVLQFCFPTWDKFCAVMVTTHIFFLVQWSPFAKDFISVSSVRCFYLQYLCITFKSTYIGSFLFFNISFALVLVDLFLFVVNHIS